MHKADWDDVASPGLLKGLLTSTESAKDFVEDDDHMFPVFCERIKEHLGKKLELIREIHRRKFQVDQSILQASTLSRTNNESGSPSLSRSKTKYNILN